MESFKKNVLKLPLDETRTHDGAQKQVAIRFPAIITHGRDKKELLV